MFGRRPFMSIPFNHSPTAIVFVLDRPGVPAGLRGHTDVWNVRRLLCRFKPLPPSAVPGAYVEGGGGRSNQSYFRVLCDYFQSIMNFKTVEGQFFML